MRIGRTFDLLEHIKETYPDKLIFTQKEDGVWKHCKGIDYYRNSYYLHYGLMASGFKPGDKILLLLPNCMEWNFFSMATALSGGIVVPVYEQTTEDILTHIIRTTTPSGVVVYDNLGANRIAKVSESLSLELEIFTIKRLKRFSNYKELIALGKKYGSKYNQQSKMLRKNVKRDALAEILFTSGTKSTSKGVVLTHKNILSNAFAASEIQTLYDTDTAVVALSLSFAMENMQTYMFQYLGVHVVYTKGVKGLLSTIQYFKPQYLSVVPRLLDYIYDKAIYNLRKGLFRKIENKLSSVLDFAGKYEPRSNDLTLKYKYKFVETVFLKRINKQLGGNLKYIYCSGGMVSENIVRTFFAAGIPVMQGYGLTENMARITSNSLKNDNFRVGSVGKPLPNVKLLVSDGNRIFVSGPSLALGYLIDSERIQPIADKDGWFDTGDIGFMSKDGYLWVQGRSEDDYMLKNGGRINAHALEVKLCLSPLIKKALVYGHRKKFLTALIVPDFRALRQIVPIKLSTKDSLKEMIKHPKVEKIFQLEIGKLNSELSGEEQIKKFFLCANRWSVASGELSLSQNVKRQALLEKHYKQFAQLYKNTDE